MIIKDDFVFEFESTGRTFNTGVDGISLTLFGTVRYGYDGHVELNDENGHPNHNLEFTKDEKKELALHVIDMWRKWAELTQGELNRHTYTSYQL